MPEIYYSKRKKYIFEKVKVPPVHILFFLIAFCNGCRNIETLTPFGNNYLLMGQSNSLWMGYKGGIQELDKQLTHFGSYPNTYLQCSVENTLMDRWIPSGNLYQACIDKVLAANRRINIVFFWQGEAEVKAGDAMAVRAWPAKFESMVIALKKQFPGVRVFYIRLTSNGNDDVLWRAMHDEQTNLPGATMINVDGITQDSLNPSNHAPLNPHYDVAGYQAIADRWAVMIVGKFQAIFLRAAQAPINFTRVILFRCWLFLHSAGMMRSILHGYALQKRLRLKAILH
jgi:hypothetical protein